MGSREAAEGLSEEVVRSSGSEGPYENVGTDGLPDWWSSAVEEYREFELRSYQPTRLSDGTVKELVVRDLRSVYGVDVSFVGKNVKYGDRWCILLDGAEVATVAHRRTTAGYSVFEIDAEELERLVVEQCED